jgi:DNA repair exonuclease SbcCD nuclease subunit
VDGQRGGAKDAGYSGGLGCMKFAHIADVHLGYEQYNQPWRAEDFAKSFRAIAEKAVEMDVDFVIIAGDLFHRSVPSPKTIKEAIEILWIFRRENIPVFAIEGNHDKTSRDISAYHLLESIGMLNVLGLRRRPVEVENVKSVKIENVYLIKGFVEDVEITGDRHRSRWQLEKVLPLLKPESERSVLVLHQAVKEVVDIDLDIAYELTLNNLPKASYYAFGHIHLPKIYEFNGKFIAYPGSVDRYDLREASQIIRYKSDFTFKEGIKKGFVVVRNFKPEFVEMKTRDLYDVEIETNKLEELEKRFVEVLERISGEGMLVAKLRCPDSADVRKLNEIALKNLRYAEVRFERLADEFEEVVIQSENDFFTDFELKLLDLMKGEIDEREAYEFVIEHYLSGGEDKVEDESSEKQEVKDREAKTTEEDTGEGLEETKRNEMKAKKPKTLLDFFGGG